MNQSSEYESKFRKLKVELGLQTSDLHLILKHLKEKAGFTLLGHMTKSTPISKLKRNLEGLHVEMKNLSVFIST